MDDNNKKISITIQGNKYTMKGNVSKEHISEIASSVDNIMDEIAKSNSLMNNNMVAVLCSLNLADQLYKEQKKNAELEDQLVETENIPDLEDKLKQREEEAQFHLEKYKEMEKELTESNYQLNKYYEMVENYKEKLKQNKIEIDTARETIIDLQNQIFDNQIEIVKMKKEIDGYRNKEILNKKSFSYPKGKKHSL